MKSVAVHLALAAAGMAIWAWTVLAVQAHFFHLTVLVAMVTCCLSAGRCTEKSHKEGDKS